VSISHDFVGIGFECPRHRIDRQWNIVLRFCDIATIGDLPASKFDFLNYRVFSANVTAGSWDIKSGETWQEDFQWECGRCGCSVRYCRTLNLTVEFPANPMTCFGLLL
jgi:hypothetical protein